MGLTWETVVMVVLVPTRLPIWAVDSPAIPLMGE
jgi:hypothetical protein